jgi:hypothetical protein
VTPAQAARLVVAVVVAVATSITFASTPAAACSCATPDSVIGRADAVFIGRLDPSAPRTRLRTEVGRGAAVDLTFDVEQVFEGSVRRRQHVIDELITQCGRIGGERLVVFGFTPEDVAVEQPGGVYAVSSCSVSEVPSPFFEVADLGSPSPPLPGEGPSARGVAPAPYRRWPAYGAGVVAVAAAAWASITVRRRLRS